MKTPGQAWGATALADLDRRKEGSPGGGRLLWALGMLILVLHLPLPFWGCQHGNGRSAAKGSEPWGGEPPKTLESSPAAWKGMGGKAEMTITAGNWFYSGRGVFYLELPDRVRWEAWNMMGLADFILCSDGRALELTLPGEKRVLRGNLDPALLLEWMGSETALSCIPRIAMGYPPLPLDGTHPSMIYRQDGSLLTAFEKGNSDTLRQRLWLDERGEIWRQGEVLDERGSWLSFKIEEAQRVDGSLLPRRLTLELRRKGIVLNLLFREIKPLPTPNPEVFRLPLPLPEGFTVVDLGEGPSGR